MTTQNRDEGAVRAVLDGIYEAWAKNDAKAFVADYAEGATATLPGSYLQSREEIRATMAALFTGQLEGSRAVHEVLKVRLFGDAAIVNSRGAVIRAGQTKPDPYARETWFLTKTEGKWRVHAFHNSPEARHG